MKQGAFDFADATIAARPPLRLVPGMGLARVLATSPVSGAVLSPCETYRYLLWRRWGPGPVALWCMVNPSVADHAEDDATIRRVRSFTASLGLSAFAVVNLFAWRDTHIERMWKADRMGCDIVGPENDAWLSMACASPDVAALVAGWGRNGGLRPERARLVCERLYDAAAKAWETPRPFVCLGFTEPVKGIAQPKHPLMLAGKTLFVPVPDPRLPAQRASASP